MLLKGIRSVLLFAVLLLVLPDLFGDENSDPVRLYVSIQGNDAWSGRLPEPNQAKTDGPFATLGRARDTIRSWKKDGSLPSRGVEVLVREGVYSLEQSFSLGEEDSGTETASIIYMAYPGDTVRLSGGKSITGFKPVSEPEAIDLLDEEAEKNIVQADLKSLGVTDYGSPDSGGAEVFFNDNPMRISRWPNEGFVKIADIVVKDGHQIHGREGSQVGKFNYEGDRPERWVNEKDPWLQGYWFWDWSDQSQRITSINTGSAVISLATPYHHYGYRKGQWYFAFNMLGELDSPGEWYIDREKGILYFWPPKPVETAETIVSVLPNLIVMKDVSFVSFKNFTFEACRETAIRVTDGERVQLADCVIRNTGSNGADLSGARHSVVGCEIYNTGSGGIALNGGDRKTLTPSGLLADNNHIHHFGRVKRMYTPGISLHGVGVHVAHNLIHNAPHIAISFGGNENCIEFNEIHHVCMESNDAGAIYTGRNWTMRGNVIRYNYLHHINGFEKTRLCRCVSG